MEFLGGLAQFLQEEFGMFYIIDILVLHFCLLQAVPLNRFYIPPLPELLFPTRKALVADWAKVLSQIQVERMPIPGWNPRLGLTRLLDCGNSELQGAQHI